MLHLVGCVFVILGTTGTAWCFCIENKEKLQNLKMIQFIFENFKHLIAYQKLPVTEGCRQLAGKVSPPFSEAFMAVYQELISENGKSMPQVWKKHMSKCLCSIKIKEKEKKLLLSFPDCFGYMDENSQANALENSIREISSCIKEQEEEQKNKNKLLMSFGMAGGILISILLL